jgi:hypothetical protein
MARYSKKRGDVRPIGRTTHTEARLAMRDKWWEPIKRMMQQHFLILGAKRRMSQATGIADSQLHCYSCDDCEHNQEPTFSTGMQIVTYLATYEWKAAAIEIEAKRSDREYLSVACFDLLQTLCTGVRCGNRYVSPNRINLNKFNA